MNNNTVSEVLEFVRENDVKFIRLGFCDPFGFMKNISIMSDRLASAFEDGVPFDAHAVRGFADVTESDLILFPDPATLMLLPWRPGPGRVIRFYCDIKYPDGTPFLRDSRYILKQVVERCGQMGYRFRIGAECEFYLFKTGDSGGLTQTPHDRGGYLDISPLDKGEDIRREICLCLEEMGIYPQASHHEKGPGQSEIDFEFGDALTSADNMLTFKAVVKAIAERNGLFASFMPKPIADAPGSGMHINLSLMKGDVNVFRGEDNQYQDISEYFIAGILAKMPEITLFLNPIANSYDRFGRYEAPKYVSWSRQNRAQLVRVPAVSGNMARMVLRSPDPSINPYLAFALVIAAGMDGIEERIPLPPAVDLDLHGARERTTSSLTPLPADLSEAIQLAKNSALVKRVLGEQMLTRILEIKEAEAAAFQAAPEKAVFYRDQYFGLM